MKVKGGRDTVASILAIGLALAIVLITVAVAWASLFNKGATALSDNGTKVLIGVLGGLIGVLGTYLGFHAAKDPPPEPPASNDGENP
jgi:uncharacterized YccA/Bax inhibitor family protein